MEENKDQQNPQSVGEMLKENQQAIIHKKEEYYDKLIDSTHLTTRSLDIIIVGLILLAIVIVITQMK